MSVAASGGESGSTESVVLGSWCLIRELGAGGMGTVWQAERADGAFRKTAAVKLVNHDVVRPESMRRFSRERQILADLDHPNICRLLDGGTAPDGRPYLVMEMVDGLPLDRYFEQGTATVADKVGMFAKLCDALSYAHEHGVIHRDLKPSNVMVTNEGEPKVLDFGIARPTGSSEPALTRTGDMALTPCYASPEQWHGEDIGPASDVFSLGVMLYESFTGTRPRVPGWSGLEQGPLAALSLDEGLCTVLMRAVHADTGQRYASMDEFGRALREHTGTTHRSRTSVRVFLSCRCDIEADLHVALSLYDALADAGVSVFFAPKSTAGGEGWVQAAARAMASSNVLLVVLSQPGVVSEMVARELELARRLHAERGHALRIVPVWVGPTEADSSGFADPLVGGHEFRRWRVPEDTTSIVGALLVTDGVAQSAPSSSGANVGLAARSEAIASQPEFPGGVVPPESPYYVAVPQEGTCFAAISRPNALIRIKGPRQTGKSSLMTRILTHAQGEGARTVTISLQLVEGKILSDLDRFLRWLCAVVSRRLGLTTHDLDAHWDDLFGSKDNCTAFFEERVLPGSEPLVLAIDHVDRVFDFPATAEEFLSLLRAWNEMGKGGTGWGNLRMVLVYATESYLPMDINHSPFNVGLPVTLSKWSMSTVRELAQRHGVELGEEQFIRLAELLDGHPHLTRVALYHLAQGKSLGDILAVAATDDGPFGDHLKSLLWHLKTQPRLGEFAALVMSGTQPLPLDTELSFKLASLGLVQLRGNSVLLARGLYRNYLNDRLHTTHSSTNPT